MSEKATETLPMPATDRRGEHAVARVREALTGLRYGEVTVIVQDGVIVQIERTEKIRLRS